jgi:predicted O-linked N-acetylglucosamine transferase (SPINDLY family)
MSESTGENSFEAARQLHQAGRLHEAEAIYRKLLEANPSHGDAMHLLGYVTYQTGREQAGLELIRRAIAMDPKRAMFYCNEGVVLGALRCHDEAIESYRRALALQEKFPEVWFNLGGSMRALGKNDESLAAYTTAVTQRPDYAEAYNALGDLYAFLVRWEDAAAAFEQALKSRPNYPEAASNLGLALERLGRLDDAIVACRKSLSLRPESPNTCYRLANTLMRRGNWMEAVAGYRRVIAMQPDFPEAYTALAGALREKGDFNEALSLYRQAMVLKPSSPEIYHNLAMTLEAGGQYDEAGAAYRQALKLRPEYVESMNNLGNIFRDTGYVEEAVDCYEKALALRPTEAVAHSNKLYCLHLLPRYEPGNIFQEHEVWDMMQGRSLRHEILVHDNDRTPNRTLRVGYVSPDFHSHSVAYFAENLIAHHDRAMQHVYCYSDAIRPDAVTQRFRRGADQWRSIVGMSDSRVAELIRKDKIDILIDLAGHTAQNRLLVFARKPAPIQASYIGYPDTTGLSAMDYRLTDAICDPPRQTEQFHSEKLMRLPGCFLCYRPPADAPDVGPLPAQAAGHVTFGSFNHIAKISSVSLHLWCEILNAVPNSKLLIKNHGMAQESARDNLLRRFAAEGINADRLDLRGKIPTTRDHLDLYNEVDIALDTFPYNGTTTTCEALWMGVPVVTLAGRTHVSRVGLSLLTAISSTELASDDGEQYITRAIDLAADLPSLTDIRADLRAWMKESDLTNGPKAAENFEHALRKMWLRWCSNSTPVVSAEKS